ncbi:MAG: hypothetical protein LC793_12395 [Thermomicrobia bacterium]|nr:hypothetical protein [Thermomicrobia bacterium]MCA1722667.1 hypothetical protein [Thermomicrobia bacterium]
MRGAPLRACAPSGCWRSVPSRPAAALALFVANLLSAFAATYAAPLTDERPRHSRGRWRRMAPLHALPAAAPIRHVMPAGDVAPAIAAPMQVAGAISVGPGISQVVAGLVGGDATRHAADGAPEPLAVSAELVLQP